MGWNVITCRRGLGGFATAAVLALASAWAAEPSVTPAVYASDGGSPEVTLATYRALAASQARDYDRRQDISPRQLVILLEVSERTGASLGQALATGEHESARTWNDHVRPTLKSGSLGAATGVWQFQPTTFQRIVKKFGAQFLAASEADAAMGRQPMDLGAGPFTDAQVRGLIRETVDGQRGADDAEVQLLRHNFAVLAFAKHYLSIESGATTPEEDYLFHFLGEGQGRRILALARGEAQYTLCVKPVAPATPAQDTGPELFTGAGTGVAMQWDLAPRALPPLAAGTDDLFLIDAPARPRVAEPAPKTKTTPPAGSDKKTAKKPAPAPKTKSWVAARRDRLPPVEVPVRPRVDLDLRRGTGPGAVATSGKAPAKKPATAKKTLPPPASGLVLALPGSPGVPPVSLHLRSEQSDRLAPGSGGRPALKPAASRPTGPWVAPEPAEYYPMPALPPSVSSAWGLPADSPTVTGNLGMFYRDGKGQTQPYTWAEFLQNLGRRVRAADQPALVRAKYGVGFPLKGGDMPEWTFDPEQVSTAMAFRHENGQAVLVPEAMVTGTLDRDETRRYKERLAELVSRGEDQPLGTLPPEALAALHHLGLLDPKAQAAGTQDPQVQQALHDFRKQVGKDQPDDPEHAGRLMPAERVALELYEQRIAHYATLQTGQDATLSDAVDILRVSKLPARFQRAAAPYVAAVQTALAERGLLTKPTQKTVWRDKKRRKQESYKTVPFAGKPDKATVAALNTFQLRHGLRRTDGVADAVTLATLGLPPMGLEVLLPPSGPSCASEGDTEAAPRCEVPTRPSWGTLGVFSPNRPRALPRPLDGSPEPDGGGPPAGAGGSELGDCETQVAI